VKLNFNSTASGNPGPAGGVIQYKDDKLEGFISNSYGDLKIRERKWMP
jgi:hypothetical protein